MAAWDREEALEAIRNKGRIDVQDVLALRRDVFGDGLVSQHEADMLFELNDHAEQTCPEWTVFFLEVMVDFTVRQVEPYGYVGEDAADWLVARISEDGLCKSGTELELLIRILERATETPAGLIQFALRQVLHAVVHGDSRVIGGEHQPGRVDDGEVVLLRRILFAPGGEGRLAVSRAEAEVLIEIEEAAADADNAPAWADLYTRAIANFMLASSGWTPPSRAEALRADAWLKDTRTDRAGFAARMFQQWPDFLGAFSREEPAKPLEAFDEDEVVDAREAEWLAARLWRDGRLTANERALLAYLKREARTLHPSFDRLLDEASAGERQERFA